MVSSRSTTGRGDGEARVAHVVREGALRGRAARLVQAAQEGKDMLAKHGVHVARRQVLEARPAQVFERAAPGVQALGVEAHGGGLEAPGLVVFALLVAVEAAQE